VGDLSLDAFQPVALAYESSDLHSLRTDVVELENRRIGEAAVGAMAGAQDLDDVRPRRGSPLLKCLSGLPPVKITAKPHVLAPAVLAPGLATVKVGGQQDSAAPVADLCRLPPDLRRRRSLSNRRRDTSRPYAHGREGYANPTADLPQ